MSSHGERLLHLVKHTTRKIFMSSENSVKLESIPSWHKYFLENVTRLRELFTPLNERGYNEDNNINEKVSLWNGDITQLEIDAIVNAANSTLLGGGGVDGAIHAAAGEDLQKECRQLGGCNVGDAKLTGAYNLSANYVIHTVGPQVEDPSSLMSCYEKSLQLMIEYNLRTIAFPCISTGIYGYPNYNAADIALGTARRFLNVHKNQIDRIIFCTFLQSDKAIYEELMQKFFPVQESSATANL